MHHRPLRTAVIGCLAALCLTVPGTLAQTTTNITYATRQLADGLTPDADPTELFIVRGRITSPNMGSDAPVPGEAEFFNFWIQDPTVPGGTNAGVLCTFDLPDPGSDPDFDATSYQVGREVEVYGTVGQSTRGVTSIAVGHPSFGTIPFNDFKVTDTSQVPVPPAVVTLADIAASPEDYEGTLVQVANVTYTGTPTIPELGRFLALEITDGTSILNMFVDEDTEVAGQLPPTNAFTLVGVLTQHDLVDDNLLDDGYQISPRYYRDLVVSTPQVAPILLPTPGPTAYIGPNQELTIQLLAQDENTADTLSFSVSGAPGGSILDTANQANSRLAFFRWTPTLGDADTTRTVTFTVNDGSVSSSSNIEIVVLSAELAAIDINEVLYDVPPNPHGDVNGDGARDSTADEFVEIYNSGSTDVDISGWTLQVNGNTNLLFAPGTTFTGETAIVVFGGFDTNATLGSFGGAQVLIADDWDPNLSNDGAIVGLVNALGAVVDEIDYSSFSSGPRASINRNPDITGTAFAEHDTIFGAGGALYSPGTQISGAPFPGSGVTNSAPLVNAIAHATAHIGRTVTLPISATDPDGNAIIFSTSGLPATAMLNDAGDGTGTIVYTGLAVDADRVFTGTVYASDGVASNSTVFELNVPPVAYSGLILNEVFPNDGTTDANQDGSSDGVDDEFVEVVNDTGAALDLAGVTISDAQDLRHTFGSLILPAGGAVVVFAGGDLSNFANSAAVTASSLEFSFGNNGDSVTLADPAGNRLDGMSYLLPGETFGQSGVSYTRDPDITGSFTNHNVATGSTLNLSPGLQTDGSSFLTDQPPTLILPASVVIQVGETNTFTVNTSEPDGDAITISIVALPPNATFVDHTDGTASFTIAPDITQTGVLNVAFVASDVDGATTNDVDLIIVEGSEYVWDFESGLQGWTVVSQASNRDWTRAAGTGAEGSGAYMTINGYTADVAGDDWLISPSINLTAFASPALTFWVQRGFNGIEDNRQLLISTTYDGVSDPSLATWQTTYIADPGDATWPEPEQSVSLAEFSSSATVHVAFRYQSDGPGTTQHDWSVDQIRVVDNLNSPPTILVPGPQAVVAGDTVSFDVTATEADGDPVVMSQINKPGAATYLDSGTGTGSFEWVTSEADIGTITVTFVATDKDGADTNTVDITVAAVPSGDCGLIFSEYIEGDGNNKALELYNGTDSEIDFLAGDYVIVRYNNGGTTPSVSALTGVVASAGTYVVANSQANAEILALADQTAGTATFYNGNDAVVLLSGGVSGTVVDCIGRVGEDPGSFWGTEPVTTKEHTLRRKINIAAGDTVVNDPFDPVLEWDGFPQDDIVGLGTHDSNCPGGAGDIDSDGDGATDAEEAIAGTDPGSAADVFTVIDLQISSGNLQVTLPTKATRNYVIEYTDDLGDPDSWQELAPGQAGSGGDDVFIDLSPTNRMLFYRGDVRLP